MHLSKGTDSIIFTLSIRGIEPMYLSYVYEYLDLDPHPLIRLIKLVRYSFHGELVKEIHRQGYARS